MESLELEKSSFHMGLSRVSTTHTHTHTTTENCTLLLMYKCVSTMKRKKVIVIDSNLTYPQMLPYSQKMLVKTSHMF